MGAALCKGDDAAQDTHVPKLTAERLAEAPDVASDVPADVAADVAAALAEADAAPPADAAPAHPIGKEIVDAMVSDAISSASSQPEVANRQSQQPQPQLQVLPVRTKQDDNEDIAEKMKSSIHSQIPLAKNSSQGSTAEANPSKQALSVTKKTEDAPEPKGGVLECVQQVEMVADTSEGHHGRECPGIANGSSKATVEEEPVEHRSVDAQVQALDLFDASARSEEVMHSSDCPRLNESDEPQHEKVLPASSKADTDIHNHDMHLTKDLPESENAMVEQSDCEALRVGQTLSEEALEKARECNANAQLAEEAQPNGNANGNLRDADDSRADVSSAHASISEMAEPPVVCEEPTPTQDDRLSSTHEADSEAPNSSADMKVARSEDVVLEGVDNPWSTVPKGNSEQAEVESEAENLLKALPNTKPSDPQPIQNGPEHTDAPKDASQASFLEAAVHQASQYNANSKSSKSKVANRKKAPKGKRSKKRR